MKKLPKQLFVAIDQPGGDEEYFHAAETLGELVDSDQMTQVGVYELKEKITAKTRLQICSHQSVNWKKEKK